jgi:hypothetical protein
MSRRSTTTLSQKRMKVYKPTPSMRQLQPDLWTVEENNLDEMIQRANNKGTKIRDHQRIVSESEDDDSDDDYEDENDEKQSSQQSSDEQP